MFKLPTNWQVKSLGEVADVIAGQSPPSTTYNENRIGLPFYQGKADFGEKYPSVRVWCSEPTKIAIPNDILISVRAPVGPTNICDTEACIGRGLSAIRAKKYSDYMFILYFLRSIEYKLVNQGRGSTFSAITQSELKNISIPIPPLPIQKQIAEILEKADEAKQKRKEANKLTDEFLQSIFIEMFGDPVKNPKGWEVKKLEKVCITNPRASELNSVSNNLEVTFIPMASVSEIDGKIEKYETKKINEVKSGFTYFREDDILFAKITPCMENGKCAIAKNLINGIGFGSTEFHIIRPNNFLLPDYIHFTFRNPLVRKEAAKHFTGSAGQQRVPTHYIHNFLIPIPPVSFQQQFAEIVNKTETLKVKQKQSEQELENLFQSLMQKAFKGELM